MFPALPLALLLRAPVRSLRTWGPRAPSMRRVRHRCDVIYCAMASRARRGRRENCTHWQRRLLVRARLVHDVLRVVFPRVGLRAAALRCEQQHSKEWKEGLPHQCEELPPSSLKHSRGRHSCRRAFSMQMGSDVARNRSVFVRSRFSAVGFFAPAAETRPGGVARPLLQSRKVPRPGRRGAHLSKASLKLLAPIGCNNN